MAEEVNSPRRPLSSAATFYLAAAYTEAEEAGKKPLTLTFQELTDAQGDHNQNMINAIEAASPDLNGAIDQLMKADKICWTGVVNHIFDLAEAQHESWKRR